MSTFYFNCAGCNRIFNEYQDHHYCECERLYCAMCEDDFNLEFEVEENEEECDYTGNVLSCVFCKIQEKFRKDIKDYPCIFLTNDNEKNAEVNIMLIGTKLQFSLYDLLSYKIEDNKLTYTLKDKTVNVIGTLYIENL